MTRFWGSFIQPTEDFRPINYPPNESILGWWKSGEDSNGHAILCAAIQAEDDATAREAVTTDWPEAEEWRFLDAMGPTWRITSDRFPLSDWMKTRMDEKGGKA